MLIRTVGRRAVVASTPAGENVRLNHLEPTWAYSPGRIKMLEPGSITWFCSGVVHAGGGETVLMGVRQTYMARKQLYRVCLRFSYTPAKCCYLDRST